MEGNWKMQVILGIINRYIIYTTLNELKQNIFSSFFFLPSNSSLCSEKKIMAVTMKIIGFTMSVFKIQNSFEIF